MFDSFVFICLFVFVFIVCSCWWRCNHPFHNSSSLWQFFIVVVVVVFLVVCKIANIVCIVLYWHHSNVYCIQSSSLHQDFHHWIFVEQILNTNLVLVCLQRIQSLDRLRLRMKEKKRKKDFVFVKEEIFFLSKNAYIFSELIVCV